MQKNRLLRINAAILFIFLAFLPSVSASSLSLNFEGIEEARPFIIANGQVTEDVVKLLGLTGIRIEGDPLEATEDWPQAHLILKSRDLKEVTQAVQGKVQKNVSWLRSSREERWHTQRPVYLEESTFPADQIISIFFDNLSTREAVDPKSKKFDAIIFLGSSLDDFYNRIRYLTSVYESSETPIYILTGDRDLDSTQGETLETWQKITGNKKAFIGPFPTNELEMSRMVADHFGLKYKIIYGPKQPNALRSTTADTLQVWLKTNPQPGRYLVSSSQPFVTYQAIVLKRIVKQHFKTEANQYHIETIGPKIPQHLLDKLPAERQASILLDNLARCFYELTWFQDLYNK